MTREKAREALSVLKIYDAQRLREAVDMAIEALSADAVSLTGTMKYLTKPHNYCEVVRCKDCRHYHKSEMYSYCSIINVKGRSPKEIDFCSCGERREP